MLLDEGFRLVIEDGMQSRFRGLYTHVLHHEMHPFWGIALRKMDLRRILCTERRLVFIIGMAHLEELLIAIDRDVWDY